MNTHSHTHTNIYSGILSHFIEKSIIYRLPFLFYGICYRSFRNSTLGTFSFIFLQDDFSKVKLLNQKIDPHEIWSPILVSIEKEKREYKWEKGNWIFWTLFIDKKMEDQKFWVIAHGYATKAGVRMLIQVFLILNMLLSFLFYPYCVWWPKEKRRHTNFFLERIIEFQILFKSFC